MNSLSRARELYESARRMMVDGQEEEAVRLLEESAAQAPHFKTMEILGELYLKRDDYGRAVTYLAAATSLNRQVRPRSLLALALVRAGLPEDAKHHIDEVLSEVPGNRLANQALTEYSTATGEGAATTSESRQE